MQARINTIAFSGLEVLDVDLQVQISSGMPAFNIVGLPDKAVAESKERVRAAFSAIGISFPSERVTVNLAPANLLKEGSHFDLAIAAGILACMKILPQEELHRIRQRAGKQSDGVSMRRFPEFHKRHWTAYPYM